MIPKYTHLTQADHEQLAAILKRVQDDLISMSPIVNRAAFTDEISKILARIQGRIINPLQREHYGPAEQQSQRAESPYPTIYSVRR